MLMQVLFKIKSFGYGDMDNFLTSFETISLQ